jgi:hypothetical protein
MKTSEEIEVIVRDLKKEAAKPSELKKETLDKLREEIINESETREAFSTFKYSERIVK